jgi:hypothetical protein
MPNVNKLERHRTTTTHLETQIEDVVDRRSKVFRCIFGYVDQCFEHGVVVGVRQTVRDRLQDNGHETIVVTDAPSSALPQSNTANNRDRHEPVAHCRCYA